jgi:N-hydroxyarylamine O-acetyltransferase
MKVSEPTRLLVIGEDTLVLETVVDEVAAAGTPALGATPATARDMSDAFDLVAFGGGLAPETRRELEAQFRARNPTTRFLAVYAPYAASQIVAAARSNELGPGVDLAAYCKRIGWDRPLEPTLEVLRGLQERHLASISFEAIDVLLDRRIDLSPAAVEAKIVGRGRGGYCYEQNGLFKRVLKAIGFKVEAMIARVRWMAQPGTPVPPATHMVLRVTIGSERWLVDVGFGSAVPPAPLKFDSTEPQDTSHETYRIIPFGAAHLVQLRQQGHWVPVYDVTPEPLLDHHYEVANWFTSTHPSSHFRHQLVAARTTPDARHALLEARLTIRRPDGSVERKYLDADGIEHALRETFALPVEPDWRPIIERAAKRTPRLRSLELQAAE